MVASDNDFEVGDNDNTYMGNVVQMTCGCDAFQLGIPCNHASLRDKVR